MGKNKLQRFAELTTLEHVFQPFYHELLNGFPLKGKWHQDFFKNKNPITLELGCGKGEYSVGLANKNKNKNFIGIDFKGARIWRGAVDSIENKLTNIAFIRTRIDQIEQLFNKDEVSEIWITFPDPQPKSFKSRKRLTSPMFLNRYKNILIKGGIIHLKTDNKDFYDFTMETIMEEGHTLLQHTDNLYQSEITGPPIEFKTFYEKMFLKEGIPICYLNFKLKTD